jgi:hypothetical protein
MGLYEFRNVVTREVREVYARMSEAPIEDIVLREDGSYRPATPNDEPGTVWERLLSVPQGVHVHDAGGVRYPNGIPYSRTLPGYTDGTGKVTTLHGHKVREVSPGTFATMAGRPICDTAGAMKRHCENLGCSHHKD